MAGVKGRSGRKPKPPAQIDGTTPLEILLAFARDKTVSDAIRVRAAGLAAQYVHHKRGEGGKKEAVQAASEAASAGRFAPKEPPKLVVNNR